MLLYTWRTSHLLQMRGLKHVEILKVWNRFKVASFTDAWIETLYRWSSRFRTVVASFTDAWIETKQNLPNGYNGSCRIFYRCVDWNRERIYTDRSKSCRIFYRCVDWNSAPMAYIKIGGVASFTDAWIETKAYPYYPNHQMSRIFYRCVDWNHIEAAKRILKTVASFTDAWIETIPANISGSFCSRIFYRCVDWNSFHNGASGKGTWSHLLQMRGLKLVSLIATLLIVVASFTDAWIETHCRMDQQSIQSVASFTDAWIET